MADLGDFSLDDDDETDDLERGTAIDDEPSPFETMAVDPVRTDAGTLGAIAVSEGLVIGEVDDDTRIRAYIAADERATVRLGSYVVAPYPDGELLFAKLAALEYAQEFEADDATEIHSQRAMTSNEFDERDYKLIASLDPLAVLSVDEDAELTRRMPDRVPKPETVIRSAGDREEIKTGLAIPAEGVFLGHLAVGGERVQTVARPPTIDYRLRDEYAAGDPLVFRHTLVAGGTGSGKTHVAKNILRQYLGNRYPTGDGREPELAVVQFDPQDEYAQMHDDNEELSNEQTRRLEQEAIAYGGWSDTKALVPVVGTATYDGKDHRAEWLRFTIPFAMVRQHPWLVAGGSLNENQYQGLREVLDRFFRDAGADGTYRAFRQWLDDPTRREQLHETGRVHEATYDAIKRRVARFDHVFDQDAEPITDLIHELVRPGGLTTIPTYHIGESRASETIVLAVASLLIDEKLSSDPTYDRIKSTPLIVGMDEAHTYLTGAESVQATRVIGKFSDAAKQGRKERLGLFLITQDPQDIAEPIFKQVNTRIVLNLGDEGAIESLNLPRGLRGRVPYMEQGGMVVHSPDNSEPVELKGLDHCVTRHGREH